MMRQGCVYSTAQMLLWRRLGPSHPCVTLGFGVMKPRFLIGVRMLGLRRAPPARP